MMECNSAFVLLSWIGYIRSCCKLRRLIVQSQNARQPDHFGGLFTVHHDPQKKPDKDEEKKVKGVLERLRHYGIDNIVESNVEYALHSQSSQGDPEAAFRLLMMLEDTYEGIIKPYNADLKLLGAVNKEGITCYLDTLLFAMFARLDSFEAMLYDNFQDAKRKRLAGLLRLWVNMLRTGRLITTDVTQHITDALVECGWRDAGKHRQQDPSEAFTFITGQLELPMLTLKMDMYHTGKEDPQDDHKFINERLLEVAILDEPPEGSSAITLEDCLEHYFNNRIEVKRHMQNQRRNTLKSANIPDSKIEKESGTHVEVLEVGPETPIAQSPAVMTPIMETANPSQKLRPSSGRKRADSIFSQRKVELVGIDPESVNKDDANAGPDGIGRKMSTRTEVLMPAWQFFKLLPWYADNMPTSDAQVAAHFSKKRPVLGICLKRYSYTNTGQAQRRDTYVDIPLEIAVPNFVSDDNMQEEGPLVGNFRLMLQSVVCHRGVSVNSGHYICLCRGRAANSKTPSSVEERSSGSETDDGEDPWMRFDDLATERVTSVDIHDALRKETPYLLFYQVLPIGEDGNSIHDLPSYTEATSRSQSDATPLEKPYLNEPSESENALNQYPSESNAANRPSIDAINWLPTGTASERTSIDATAALESGRADPVEGEERPRKSITIDTSSNSGSIRTDPASSSIPTTPSEEKSNSLLSVANKIGSRRGSRVSRTSGTGTSRSRPTSTGPDNTNRFSLNMSKLTQRMSRNDAAEGPVIQPSEQVAAELAGQKDAEEQTTVVNAATLPGNTSKESVTATGKKHEKVKKEKGNAKRSKGHGHGQKQEDRDCVIM